MELAMVLNNILAAPAFEAWREGESLDVHSLFFMPDGKPRHSIFYLAHLSDGERMFFVTLLLSAVETWMRTQSGSSSLRALLYMDEIYGYLPPTANPPSKQPLLRMLKQARAFGLGLLLATQNPVDMDYKALSNTGTWFIGKLQTERDKNRLLDGLESAAGGIPRAAMDKLISSLGKRVFVMHNVHAKMPVLIQTRWTMNFLAGPMTRTQIPALNELVDAGAALQSSRAAAPASRSESKPQPKPSVEALQPVAVPTSTAPVTSAPAATAPANRQPSSITSAGSSMTKPTIPAGIREYYFPQNFSLPEAFQHAQKPMPSQAMIQGVTYRASLLASAQVRLLDRKYGVDTEMNRAALVSSVDSRGIVRWEEYTYNGPSLDKVETMPAASARFSSIDAPFNSTKLMTALQKDFTDWIFRNSEVTARANTKLKVFAGPDITAADFMKQCAETAREACDAEVEKKTSVLEKKIRSIEDKLGREQSELREDQAELQNRNIESYANLAELGASLFGLTRKKSVTTQFAKHRLAQSAKAQVQESQENIVRLSNELEILEKERDTVADEINNRWGSMVSNFDEVAIKPKKTDIYVNIFGVAWMPYYIVQSGSETLELPAFGADK